MKVWYEVRFEYVLEHWFRLARVKFGSEEEATTFSKYIVGLINKDLRNNDFSFMDEDSGPIKMYRLKRIEQLVGVFRCTEQQITENKKLLG